MKIMMTGGHVTPALATIEEIRSRRMAWVVVFVGRKYSLEGSSTYSEEYRLIRALGIRFLSITAGKLKREGGVLAILAFLKIPVGFVQAAAFVARERPAAIVSFGGYVALPISIAAWLFGIPVVTHEQTTRPGLANRIISKIATKTCTAFPDSAGMLGSRVEVTGMPVRNAILTPPKISPFPVVLDKPILFFVGGSTGSTRINDVVFRALPTLLRTYSVIHQVGRVSALPTARTNYIAKEYVSAREFSWALHNAKIVIGRSGANTVTEIALSGAVAICIPLPWSANHEQFHNAEILTSFGSVILRQEELSPTTLVQTIQSVISSWEERKIKAERLSYILPRDGAKHVVDVIERVVHEKNIHS